ncbi:hypothetical protein NLJ89_g1716 [Agrocybe chaxingu]|uniref:receptor protein-tyrosine kinase n=1 Tax=Agrocybe chaxingu TaxID=84603 RepID=A0A9W8MZI8_9AGAR|nr:hypothetical protein NLJ89_g1716 [Agrocybe chaxingu]
MSSGRPRWVVVDDTNTDIVYTGSSWFQDTGSQDSAGNFGPAYRSTLHGTKANASLSYSFSGSRVRVWGTNNIRNDSGVIDPKWECFIDQISIGTTSTFAFAENNWLFCEHNGLVDGPHVLTVNATVNREQTFWFDAIHYVPSPSASLDKAEILLDNRDPALGYGPQWQSLGATANMTTRQGSIFDFDFYGVSLSWYGFIPTELPHDATTATYSVDGETPVNFLLKGLPVDNTITIYNQKFFETKTYPAGPHHLSVVYQGNGQSTPLTLTHLVIQNGTASSTTTSAGSSGTGGAGNSGNLSGNGGNAESSTNVGAIAGGVIGGLVLILLAVLAFVFLRRRHQRRQREIDLQEEAPHMVEPFGYTPVNPELPPNHPYPSRRKLAADSRRAMAMVADTKHQQATATRRCSQ